MPLSTGTSRSLETTTVQCTPRSLSTGGGPCGGPSWLIMAPIGPIIGPRGGMLCWANPALPCEWNELNGPPWWADCGIWGPCEFIRGTPGAGSSMRVRKLVWLCEAWEFCDAKGPSAVLKLLLWVAKGPEGPAVGGRTGAGPRFEALASPEKLRLFEWITVLKGESLLPDMCMIAWSLVWPSECFYQLDKVTSCHWAKFRQRRNNVWRVRLPRMHAHSLGMRLRLHFEPGQKHDKDWQSTNESEGISSYIVTSPLSYELPVQFNFSSCSATLW